MSTLINGELYDEESKSVNWYEIDRLIDTMTKLGCNGLESLTKFSELVACKKYLASVVEDAEQYLEKLEDSKAYSPDIIQLLKNQSNDIIERRIAEIDLANVRIRMGTNEDYSNLNEMTLRILLSRRRKVEYTLERREFSRMFEYHNTTEKLKEAYSKMSEQLKLLKYYKDI